MLEAKRQSNDPGVPGSKLSQYVLNQFDNWRLGSSVPSLIASPYKLPTVIAVGGGKGGVGKSVVSANLAAVLAQSGYRVLAVDLDVGCANLHSHFGVSMPQRSLADFLVSRRLAFKDIILPAPVQGLAFVAGGREDQLLDVFESSKDVVPSLWEMIYNSKKDFKVDIVLLDLGAGTHRHTLDFFVGSHLGIMTVLPEPTSIENAYVFLKMSMQKLLVNVGNNTRSPGIAEEIIDSLATMNGGSLNKGYAHFIQGLKQSYPRFIHNYFQSVLGRYVGILINQTRDQSDADIGASMEHICLKYFGLQSKYLGNLNHDQAVLKTLRNRRLLVTDFPHSLIAKRLAMVAAHCLKIMGLQRRA